MKKLILGACLASASVLAFGAEEVKDRDGFYGYVGYYNIDLDSAYQTNEFDGFGAALGWSYSKRWSVEVPFITGRVKSGLDNRLQKNRVDTVGLDLLYNDTDWLGSATTHPFVKLGFGKHNVSNSVFTTPSPETDEFYKVGFGLQHFAGDNAFIRIGADFLDGSEDNQDDKMYYFNVGAFFGNTERSGSAPTPVAAPVKAPQDADADGVTDANDRCPSTPAGAKVDANGCPVDTDRDGVFDYQDACSGTPYGAKVDSKGCRIKLSEKVVIDMRLNFDSNKADIKSEMVSEIAKVAEFMRQYPDVSAEIQGHTDSQGAAAYNKSLSQKRADSVVSYLISNFGISASRLSGVGYGEENPIADNSTREGRAANRRVEARLETVIQK